MKKKGKIKKKEKKKNSKLYEHKFEFSSKNYSGRT